MKIELSSLKTLSLKKILYPGVAGLYLFIMLIVMVFVARFLSGELNRVFVTNTEDVGSAINEENYALIAAKLNLPQLTNGSGGEEIESPVSETVATSTASQEPDKKALSIAIYNGTNETGLAATWKKTFEDAGFIVAAIGNTDVTATSTLQIKESKRAYLPMLEPITGTENFDIETLPESSPFDYVVTFGTE